MSARRIKGVGMLTVGSLVLTRACTKACGHLLAHGKDGGAHARNMRRGVTEIAQVQANATGKSVEVFACAKGSGGWVVDVVEPERM